jgi:hypothetical protein
MPPQVFDFKTEPERPDVMPRAVALARHDWMGTAREVSLAPLALPAAAEERREALVRIDVETDRGSVELPFPMRVERHRVGGHSTFRITGTLYHLTIAFYLTDGNEGTINWHLEPGGQDAASRAAVLDLLIGMSGSGTLVLWDHEDSALLRLRLLGVPLDESITAERQFLEDILVVEAWSGQRLSLPDALDDRSSLALAELVHWIRNREMRVRFTSPITALADEPIPEADELRLHEDFEFQLFGVWVRVGRLNYRVRVRGLPTKREGKRWRVEFQPQDDWLAATITPPWRGATRAVRKIEEGVLPKPSPARRTKRRERAQMGARELVAEMRKSGPVDDLVRDEVRRQWLL